MNPIIGISIIVALVGIFIKNKTYHAPYEAFLKIDEIRIRNLGEGEIKIHNYGPDVALNIVVKSRNITIINSTKEKKGFYELWNKIEKISGEGPEQLENSDSKWYMINKGPSYIYPTIIRWKTKKKKVQKSYWRIQNGQNTKISQTSFLVYIFFAFLIPFKNLKFYLNKSKLPAKEKANKIHKVENDIVNNGSLEQIQDLHTDEQIIKIFDQDNMENLQIFAKHLPNERPIETAIKFLLKSDNIKEYIKNTTGNDVEIVEDLESDVIKNEMNRRGFDVPWSEGIWPKVKNYQNNDEGIIFFRINKDNKKNKNVIINVQGLDILNSHHAKFKEEISNKRLYEVDYKNQSKLFKDSIRDSIIKNKKTEDSPKEKNAKLVLRNNLNQLKKDILRILEHRDGNKNVTNPKDKIKISITSFSEIKGYYSIYSKLFLSNLDQIDMRKFEMTTDFFNQYKMNIETMKNRIKNNYSFITLGTMKKLVERLDKSLKEIAEDPLYSTKKYIN